MIKILFFIENIVGGGAEKVLCNLVNTMDQSRFDVTVQTLWRADVGGILRPGIRYRSCYVGQTSLNRYRSRLEAAAGLTYPLHIRGDYDIEIAYLEFGSTKILSRSTNKRAKKIAWVHSDLARKLENNPGAFEKARKQYAAYDRIVCVSQTARDSFVRLFGRSDDTDVLYNTIDDGAVREKALLPPAVPVQHRRLTMAAVGRLSEEKQYDMLLRVHKRLLEEGLEHDLWIVGEGPQRAELERYIAEQNLSDSVTLFGYQSNPYPYMQAAELLVCSSRYEGFSTFVAEGLILGKPILTTECSGMRELLGDSKYGLITDHSESGLLSGLRELLSDHMLRGDLAAKAKLRGLDFSANTVTKKTEAYFYDVLKD